MHNPEPERLKAFWTAVQDVWLKLYGSSFPTAAAINVRIALVVSHSKQSEFGSHRLFTTGFGSIFLIYFLSSIFLIQNVGSLARWRMLVINLL